MIYNQNIKIKNRKNTNKDIELSSEFIYPNNFNIFVILKYYILILL